MGGFFAHKIAVRPLEAKDMSQATLNQEVFLYVLLHSIPLSRYIRCFKASISHGLWINRTHILLLCQTNRKALDLMPSNAAD